MFPVDVLISFADGSQVRERWDGAERWIRYEHVRGARAVSAQLDPGRVPFTIESSTVYATIAPTINDNAGRMGYDAAGGRVLFRPFTGNDPAAETYLLTQDMSPFVTVGNSSGIVMGVVGGGLDEGADDLYVHDLIAGLADGP